MVKDRTLRPESTAKAGILEERGERVEHEQGKVRSQEACTFFSVPSCRPGVARVSCEVRGHGPHSASRSLEKNLAEISPNHCQPFIYLTFRK